MTIDNDKVNGDENGNYIHMAVWFISCIDFVILMPHLRFQWMLYTSSLVVIVIITIFTIIITVSSCTI